MTDYKSRDPHRLVLTLTPAFLGRAENDLRCDGSLRQDLSAIHQISRTMVALPFAADRENVISLYTSDPPQSLCRY